MPIFARRVIAPGASLVCSVVSTMWPVSAASIAIRAVSRVADLADHDHVGVGAQHRAQARSRSRGPALRLTPIWLTPASRYSTGSSIVMMFLLDVVELVQRRVERRRLARAGRAGDQHRAVGLRERRLGSARAPRPSMPSSSSVRSACDLSRMRIVAPSPRWVGTVTTRRSTLRSSTLTATRPSCGNALLGDVELAHDLDARDDAGDHPLRHAGDLVEDAVDAEADAHVALLGLEVDVGGALVDRLAEDRVDELDDRRVVGGLAQLGDLGGRGRPPPRPPRPPRRRRVSSELSRLIRSSMSTSAATATRQLRPVIIWTSSTASDVGGVGHRQDQRLGVDVADRDGPEAARRLRGDQVRRAHVDVVGARGRRGRGRSARRPPARAGRRRAGLCSTISVSGERPAVRASATTCLDPLGGQVAELDDHVGDEAAAVGARPRRGQAGGAALLHGIARRPPR